MTCARGERPVCLRLNVLAGEDGRRSASALNLTALCCDLCPAADASGKAPDDAPLRRAAHTLRRILFNVPARIVRSGRRTILRLPEGFRHARVFQATLDAVYALPP